MERLSGCPASSHTLTPLLQSLFSQTQLPGLFGSWIVNGAASPHQPVLSIRKFRCSHSCYLCVVLPTSFSVGGGFFSPPLVRSVVCRHVLAHCNPDHFRSAVWVGESHKQCIPLPRVGSPSPPFARQLAGCNWHGGGRNSSGLLWPSLIGQSVAPVIYCCVHAWEVEQQLLSCVKKMV